MAASNFKSDYGLLVSGDSTLLGNVVVQNTSVVVANSIIPASNVSLLGNTTARWVVSGVRGDFSSTLSAAGNVAINTSAFTVSSNTTAVRVGVNTAAPDSTLSVVGTANVSGAAWFGQTVTAVGNVAVGTNALVVDTTNKLVRVGTSDVSNTMAQFVVAGNTYIASNVAIADQLTVTGTVRCYGNLVVDGFMSYTGTATADIIPSGNTYLLGSSANAQNRWSLYAITGSFDSDVAIAGRLSVSNTTTTHTIAGNVSVDSGTLFVDSVNNRVGINNTAPAQALVVTGTANITGNASLSGVVSLSSNATSNQASVAGQLSVTGNLAVNSSALVVTSNATGTFVGIGTATPTSTVTVAGSLSTTGAVTVGNTVTIAGNTQVGNTTSYVRASTNGSLRLTREIEIGNTSVYSNTQTIATAGANTIIDTFVTTEYDASKYIISYHSTSNTQVFGATELLVVHNGTVVIATEYATVFSANVGFSLDADIPAASTNCHIYASATQGNLVVTMTRISML